MTDNGELSLVEERLIVDKERISDGRGRVSTRTELVSETASAMLATETVSVTRVKVGREVMALPAVRVEDDVTIIR